VIVCSADLQVKIIFDLFRVAATLLCRFYNGLTDAVIWRFFYLLFSCHSQTANAAVAMHATALAHSGISTLFAVTFHCDISLNKCTNETSIRNTAVIIVDVFIIALLFFSKLPNGQFPASTMVLGYSLHYNG